MLKATMSLITDRRQQQQQQTRQTYLCMVRQEVYRIRRLSRMLALRPAQKRRFHLQNYISRTSRI
jgi:hypothetical protein